MSFVFLPVYTHAIIFFSYQVPLTYVCVKLKSAPPFGDGEGLRPSGLLPGLSPWISLGDFRASRWLPFIKSKYATACVAGIHFVVS
jgi:hypothetical protein